jgi:hypothetical protein
MVTVAVLFLVSIFSTAIAYLTILLWGEEDNGADDAEGKQ